MAKSRHSDNTFRAAAMRLYRPRGGIDGVPFGTIERPVADGGAWVEVRVWVSEAEADIQYQLMREGNDAA